MRHMRTVFFALTVLVLIGMGQKVNSTDTLPDSSTEAWDETRKLCLQSGISSMGCVALIDALSGNRKPISLPSSGDTLTDAINEALAQAAAKSLIWANKQDHDVASFRRIVLGTFEACIGKDNALNCEKGKARMEAESQLITTRITARAKAAISDKKRFRHCKESLAPVDDPREIVKCLEKLDSILASCGTKKPCVTDNFTAYSALLVYTVKTENKDRYEAFVSQCQEQYRKLSGLGYREIWACVQDYLGLLDKAPDRIDGN